MKIVIGSESFLPNISGVAVSTLTMARHLSSRGHQVIVFAPDKKFHTHYQKNNEAYQTLRLRSIPNPFRRGFRVAFLPQKAVSHELEKIKPDIIHCADREIKVSCVEAEYPVVYDRQK